MSETRTRRSDFTAEAYERKLDRNRRYRAAHRADINARRRATWTPRPAVVLAVIPDVPAGHDLYDEARAALTGAEVRELSQDMDSGARDLLQEYVLAALDGRDPVRAVKAWRQEWRTRIREFAWGLSLVDGLER